MLAKCLGMLTKDGRIVAFPAKGEKSSYCCCKYAFLLTANFTVGHKCCKIMKKDPAYHYEKETGRMPIIGTTASESKLRTMNWLQHGCNAYTIDRPRSTPLAFWMEQDVLLYLKKYHINYSPVYGKIVDENGNDIDLSDFEDKGIFDLDRPLLHTTLEKQTGCMFCGFGCHLEKPEESRFVRLKDTHPVLYKYIFRPWEEHDVIPDPETNEKEEVTITGLNYKNIIDWINQNGGFDIRY